MANLMPLPMMEFFDGNGNPLSGGKLHSYIAGTSTPAPTYTNSTGAVQNANPVILDARGEAAVWLDPDLSYKFVLKTALDSVIWTVDNISAAASQADIRKFTGGVLSKSVAGGSNVTLTAAEAGNGILIFSGALTANISVILPASPTRSWIVINNTSGAFSLTVKTAAGSGIAVPQGFEQQLYTDGTNVLPAGAAISASGAISAIGLATLAAGLTVSGGAVSILNLTTAQTLNLASNLELGAAITSDSDSRIDFHATPGSDYDARIIRSTGADGFLVIRNLGTNGMQFQAGGLTTRLQLAGDGSVSRVIPGGSTLYPDFACRAWANINGTGTPAIKAAGNVSSITDHGVGELSLNLTSALPDANYAWNGTARADSDGTSDRTSVYQRSSTFTKSTTALRVIVNRGSTSAVLIDSDDISISIFR